MSDDLDARLRRMYSAVADHTAITTEGDLHDSVDDMRPVPIRSARTGLLRRSLLAAAAAALLIGGLVLIAPRGAQAPAEPAGSSYRHPLPLVRPEFRPMSGTETADTGPGVLRLSRIESSADGDELTYEWDRGGVSISTTGRPPTFASGRIVVRGEAVGKATETTDATSLTWLDETGITVTVSAFGEQDRSVDQLVSIADGMVFVDDEVWGRAIAYAGFARSDTLDDLGDGWTLSGSLQSGQLSINRGSYGFSGSIGESGRCAVYVDDPGRDRWFAVADGRTDSVIVTLPTGTAMVVSLRRLPGTNLAVGDFTTAPLGEARPTASCEETS